MFGPSPWYPHVGPHSGCPPLIRQSSAVAFVAAVHILLETFSAPCLRSSRRHPVRFSAAGCAGVLPSTRRLEVSLRFSCLHALSLISCAVVLGCMIAISPVDHLSYHRSVLGRRPLCLDKLLDLLQSCAQPGVVCTILQFRLGRQFLKCLMDGGLFLLVRLDLHLRLVPTFFHAFFRLGRSCDPCLCCVDLGADRSGRRVCGVVWCGLVWCGVVWCGVVCVVSCCVLCVVRCGVCFLCCVWCLFFVL